MSVLFLDHWHFQLPILRGIRFNLCCLSTVVAAVIVLNFCSSVSGQSPTIRFGNNNVIELVADSSNQIVDIYAENVGNMQLNAFGLWMQIGDGGVAIGGTDTGPVQITRVNLFPDGTIFDENNQAEVFSSPLVWGQTIDQAAEINRDGLIAQVEFSTQGIGFLGDTAEFKLRDVGPSGYTQDTVFLTTSNNLTVPGGLSGSIVIGQGRSNLPEPNSLLLLSCLSSLGLLTRRRG